MNAGRDVERLIADWLVQEAPARAPDRILGEAGRQIDRTKQQRFAAAWREPMIISMGRLVAAAAIFILAVVGAGWIGRASAPGVGGPGPTPVSTPSASPSPTQPTVASYRSARDAICNAAIAQGQQNNDAFSNPYDPGQTAAERNAKADALQHIVDFGQTLRAQISAIPVPPEMASDLSAYLARGEDNQAILEQEIVLLRAGKYSEAQQVDLLTDPINRVAEQFEQKYGLAPCP